MRQSKKAEEAVLEEDPYVRRRWFKYAGIKPERSRNRPKQEQIEVASLSNLEAEAMDILWDLERAASAMEVLEYSLYKRRDQGEEPVSFPALQSTLRRLAEKGVLESQRDEQRTIRYAPLVGREVMTARILNNVSQKLLGYTLAGLLPKLIGSVKPSAQKAGAEEQAVLDKLSAAIEEVSKRSEEKESA